MKKFLLLITFISISLPSFSYYDSNIDLTCTYVPEGTNEAFTIGPLYFGADKKVYDPDNVVVGEISDDTDGNHATVAKLYGGDWLYYFNENYSIPYYSAYTYKNNQITAYGACKVNKY